MALTTRFYAVVAGAAILTILGVGKLASYEGWLGKPTETVSAIPRTTQITHFQVAEHSASYALPVSTARSQLSSAFDIELLPWNAQGDLSLANGGATTTRFSLMDKFTGGAVMNLKVQNDYGQMEAHLASFIQAYERNADTSTGDAFFLIMGDAYPYVSAALDKLGLHGKYSAIAALGFSDGEDACMLPSNWRDLLKEGKPILIAAVPRDGDWNICVKFASDNEIRINTTQTTIDLHAFNFLDIGDWTLAVKDLKSGTQETRTVVEDGISHGTMTVVVNGAATWTPGDVDAVENFSGSIIKGTSTHEYAGQMPALLIGSKAFMAANHDMVVGMLKAIDQAAQRIRNTPEGLMAMGTANAAVFGDQPGAWWAKYYVGAFETNRAGENVHLGGSKVVTLQEQRDYFGLRPGTDDIFATVYRVFKGYDETFYPDQYPVHGDGSIPNYSDVVDTSYLVDALKDMPVNTAPIAPAFVASAAPIAHVTSAKAWNIEFDVGTATIRRTPAVARMLQDIHDTVSPTSLYVQADGFTDDTGSQGINGPLSQARAQAVLDWLHSAAPETFPYSRLKPAQGHGSDMPICVEATPACRAQNRRVQITLGN